MLHLTMGLNYRQLLKRINIFVNKDTEIEIDMKQLYFLLI